MNSRSFSKNIFWAIITLLLIAFLFSSFYTQQKTVRVLSLDQLAIKINSGEVSKIVVSGNDLNIELKNGEKATTKKESESGLSETLKNFGIDADVLKKVNIEIKEESGWKYWASILIPSLLPIIIIGWFFWMMFRQAGRGMGQALTFGKANIKLFSQFKDRITFNDVAGLKEAKEELMEVVDFLKNPKKYLDIGAKIPKGVLLYGAPGTGKTLLARAVAGEANVPFFHISGSEFVEMFVGVGASIKGDELVLIKENNEIKLLPIKEVVDKYYKENQSDITIPVSGLETLGVAKKEIKFWGFKNNKEKFLFGGSQWTKIKKVYRHKVKELYEIEYLGGKIETTGDHSVFIREKNYIKAKRADELRPGDILVNLPFKTRDVFIPGAGTTHRIKAHNFSEKPVFELDLFDSRLTEELKKYNFAMENRFILSQSVIAQKIGVSQSTVKNWQLEQHQPRFFNASVFINQTSPRLKITPELMRLLGYYAAEGRTTAYYTQFIFGIHEKELQKDCVNLIKNIFNLEPTVTDIKESNSTRINISSPITAMFFEKHCGNGSHNKQLPQFIWELPFEYIKEFLRGYGSGDGYMTKDGKLSIASVSEKIIRELTWLLAMHGIQAGVRKTIIPAGRIIKNRPLPETIAWNLIIGKTSNIWSGGDVKNPSQFKKPKIISVKKKKFDDYVYDFCGCENEAFFAGKKPILVHNSRVRDLFDTAKKSGRAIIFIDEIDAVGRERGAGLGGGHDEREQTLNQILVEMDGFEKNDKRIVIAATNRPDVLDTALLRPGRFDRRVILDLPDINDREEILKIHSKGKILAKDINLRKVAERTPGFSGADLANLFNEAALLAARKNQKEILQQDIFDSVEKVLLGPERRSRVFSKKEKEITAFHEAGHALVAASLKNADPVHKVSIVARGRTGGYTLKLPTEETYLRTKSQFMADLATMLGGYIAEKTVFKDVSTGASNDLQNASSLTRKLITKYGMSEKLGPVTFGKTEELIFLGREIATEKNYSEEVAKQIDEEVKNFIKKAYEVAEKIINSRKKILNAIAQNLIEKETIEREEFDNLIKNFKLKLVEIK
jgi:ATP-dependent metalloprotease FtsH